MKVLMINVVCGIRSTGRICTDLATELEKQGHEVKIAYGREQVPQQFRKYAVRIGSDFDVKLHGLKARVLDAAGLGSKRATEKFIKWVREYDPDVIHLHNIHGYYINIEVLFKYLKTCGKKIIWTLHDCWAFTGHSAYCDAIDCRKWKDGCRKCPQLKEYPKAMIDLSCINWKKKRALFTRISNMIIVTPSYWLEGYVKQSFLKEYPVKVIHNGIDTSQFYPMVNDFRKLYNLEDKYILLGVATSWDDMKGYSDFIKLSEMLDERYKIVMVGLTDKQLGELPSKILGIKRTSSVKELAYIYNSADLFLNLTYCENYPTVNIEAMACGTPVLTYQTGGSPEIVKKYGGIVIKKGDLKSVCSAIKEHRDEKIKNDFVPGENDNRLVIKKYLENYRGGYWSKKSKLGLLGKGVILGVAAIWDSRKGFEDFVKLSKLLNREYQIILVGLTQKQQSKLPENIIGFTRTNNVDELRELYAIADAFVNPTYEDNFPTTNIEALACGTPVITYQTGGSPEAINELTGFSIRRGQIIDVVKAIEQLKSNQNRQCVKQSENFKDKTKAKDYLKLYQL